MRYKTANDLLNQVATEVGLTRQTDVFASNDESFGRMIALANACLTELTQTKAWERMIRTATITGADILANGGKVPLPADFSYMIPQTGWELDQDVPLLGPLSPQQWTYLAGRDLVSYTIYASFRLREGEVWIFPWAENPPTEEPETNITYEYASSSTVLSNGEAGQYSDSIQNAGDIVLFQPYLFERLLKLRFLNSKGMDTQEAATQYVLALNSWEGKDSGGGPILNASSRGYSINFLNDCNLPDTGMGS